MVKKNFCKQLSRKQMKTYSIFSAVALFGLLFASCDKELKEDTQLNVSVATDNNVSFDGNTVTVKAGTPVTFNFDGDPDFITYFSGEIGNEYKYKDRTEMKPEDIVNCSLSFDIWADSGTPATMQGAVNVLISDNFKGLTKVYETDLQTVSNFEWSTLAASTEMPAPNKDEKLGTKEFTNDLSAYLGKEITVALHFKTLDNSNTMPRVYFKNMQLNLDFNNNQGSITLASAFGFTPLNIGYDLSELTEAQLSKVKDEHYGAVDGGVPGFWKINVPSTIMVTGGTKGQSLKNTWLISKPILLNGACKPDVGTNIKNITQTLKSHTYTYKKAGTYTATFVAKNANYVHESFAVVRELTIKVEE